MKKHSTAAANGSAASGPAPTLPPLVKVAAVLDFAERSLTFKADVAEVRVEHLGGQRRLHFTAGCAAVGATLAIDLVLPGLDYCAGSFPLGDGRPHGGALAMPRRSPDPGEQRFRLTAGTFSISTHDRVAGTIGGIFSGTGTTRSGTAVEIIHGSFFDVPLHAGATR